MEVSKKDASLNEMPLKNTRIDLRKMSGMRAAQIGKVIGSSQCFLQFSEFSRESDFSITGFEMDIAGKWFGAKGCEWMAGKVDEHEYLLG